MFQCYCALFCKGTVCESLKLGILGRVFILVDVVQLLRKDVSDEFLMRVYFV